MPYLLPIRLKNVRNDQAARCEKSKGSRNHLSLRIIPRLAGNQELFLVDQANNMSERRDLLKKAVSMLARSAAEQRAYLVGLGIPQNVDELALEFDDIAAAGEDMLLTGEITRLELEELGKLRSCLGNFKEPDVWEISALSEDPKWDELRRLAGHCLAVFEVGEKGHAAKIDPPSSQHPQ